MIELSTWARALGSIPKLSVSEWRALDPVARWLIACRAPVLFMTLTASILGGLMAWRDDLLSWPLWLAVTLGLLFAHATNNLLNDFTDSRRGIDKDNYYRNQYGVHVLEDGLVSTRQFWRYMLVTGGIALILGALLVWLRGGLTLNLMLAGAIFVLFYTWPLKYYGLGEPAVLLVWGPLMVGGTYYVLTAQWSWDVTWLSLLYALGPTSVLFGKHTDKLRQDREKRIRTLPVLLGNRLSCHAVITMISAQYLLCACLIVKGSFHWPLLLVFLNLSQLMAVIKVFRRVKPAQRPESYPAKIWPLWYAAHAFSHTRRFTSLFLLGLLVDTLIY